MKYALKEQIGNPLLFCGRKRQMELLLNWIDMIPGETAKSRALPGWRKSGKSAIMQRLFNILWDRNGAVIPFYFEMQPGRCVAPGGRIHLPGFAWWKFGIIFSE